MIIEQAIFSHLVSFLFILLDIRFLIAGRLQSDTVSTINHCMGVSQIEGECSLDRVGRRLS